MYSDSNYNLVIRAIIDAYTANDIYKLKELLTEHAYNLSKFSYELLNIAKLTILNDKLEFFKLIVNYINNSDVSTLYNYALDNFKFLFIKHMYVFYEQSSSINYNELILKLYEYLSNNNKTDIKSIAKDYPTEYWLLRQTLNDNRFFITTYSVYNIIFNNEYYRLYVDNTALKENIVQYVRYAIYYKNLDLFIELLDKFDFLTDYIKRTYNMLQHACSYESLNIVKYILDNNLFCENNLKSASIGTYSFLYLIKDRCSVECIQLLVKNDILFKHFFINLYDDLTYKIKYEMMLTLNLKSINELDDAINML